MAALEQGTQKAKQFRTDGDHAEVYDLKPTKRTPAKETSAKTTAKKTASGTTTKASERKTAARTPRRGA
ncbi:MAG: hypothetical protein LBV60_10380 [Streptomyces sp.]|jgi:hypothetical protein|nr:hypothetical protein [Streptomyces sp.]